MKISPMGTSGAVLRITKTFAPTGGVTRASSAITTTKTPNQIGLIPSSLTTGIRNGMVRTSIPKTSSIAPSTR